MGPPSRAAACAQVRVAHCLTVTDSALHGVAAASVDAQGRKAKKVAYISASLMVVIFTAVAFTLRGKTDSGRSEFHVEDQIAMIQDR